VKSTVRIALGTFAWSGVEAYLGSDLRAGAQAALSDYVRRVDAGSPPIGFPAFGLSTATDSAVSFDLPVDAHTLAVLEREATRQGATVSQIAAHSVLLYLAELDRLTPPESNRAA
jgi:hypothetical protein